MAETGEMKFHLKAIVLKERKKVLFAEVDNKLVDVLLSFLTLPAGTIVRLLSKYYESREAPIIGSLNCLYRSLETMDHHFFRSEEAKMMLLQPRNPFGHERSKLKINIDDTPPVQFYTCEKSKCISMYFDTVTCHCGLLMNKKVPMDDLYCQSSSKGDGVFTRTLSSFIVADDLQILPNNIESCSQILREYEVEGKDMLEEMSLSWGLQQIMTLLEGSLLWKTPLSHMIFRTPSEMRKYVMKKDFVSPAVKSKLYNLPWKTNRKVTVKAFVQKSVNRVLFIQSQEDFVEILFSFLALPLGTIHRLCDGECGLGSIGNVYKSTLDMDVKTHLKEEQVCRFISNSKLPYAYKSAALQNLQVEEDDPPNKLEFSSWWSYLPSRHHLNFIDPKGGKYFLKSPYSLTVMEDLEVSTSPASLILSTLKRLKITLADIQEHELEIGVEEISCLLKAAIYSKYALTDGLKPFLN